MSVNLSFYKLEFIYKFLNAVQQQKQNLFDELVVYACDPILYRRRVRMLSQLAEFESQILQKIQKLETDDPADLDLMRVRDELSSICNRSS